MPVIRRRLDPNTVYPEGMRYNEDTETFQSFINGEWTDNPEGDPRKQTIFPPRLTSDPACDAAASVKDALKNQIDSILLAIDNGATAATIAGTILSLFAFGPFGVFIGIALFLADQMLSAGTAALEAAFTETVWDTFACILYCNMNEQGRLSADAMAQVQTEIAAQIGGLAGGLLNVMLNLAGEGGVNNLAALGSSIGDCSECDCAEPCADADSFYAGTVNSITDNGDGTVTLNVSSVDNGAGTQYIGWGDRTDPFSPCCTFISQTAFEGTALGGAVQLCGSGTEFEVPPQVDQCYHFFLFYGNFALTTPFTCDITFSSACP